MPPPSRKVDRRPRESGGSAPLPSLNKEDAALFQAIESLSLKELLEESIRAMKTEGANLRMPLRMLRLIDELRDAVRLALQQNPQAASLPADLVARALSDDPDLLVSLAQSLANNRSLDPVSAARIAKLVKKLQGFEMKLRRELFRHKTALARNLARKMREKMPEAPKAPDASSTPPADDTHQPPPGAPSPLQAEDAPRNPLYEHLAAGLEALGEAIRKEQQEAKKKEAEEDDLKNKDKKVYEELHRDCESLEDTPYAAYLHPQPLRDPPGPRMREHLRTLAKREKERCGAAPSRLLDKQLRRDPSTRA